VKCSNDGSCFAGSLVEEDQGNLQILVQAAENDSLEHEGRGNHSGKVLKNVLNFLVMYVFIKSYNVPNKLTRFWKFG
jgi:hypothetical protein